ncbi:hypothetical protein BDQ17DRAFT_1435305 [Cyathus striatus]|nr:hypothetical protein BDQ17DRAFT_1435305 [Cyathus striatus]
MEQGGEVEQFDTELRFPTEVQVCYFLTLIYPSALHGHSGAHMDVDSTYSLLSNVNVALLALVNQLNILNINVLSPPPPHPLSHQNPLVDLVPLSHLVHMQLHNCMMALLFLPLFAYLQYLAIHNLLQVQPVLLHELLGVLGAPEELRMLDLEACVSVPLS